MLGAALLLKFRSGTWSNLAGKLLTTRTADLTTSKIVQNSVISTEGAAYTCFDVGKFYLETPLETYKYMKMPLDIFPSWTRRQYNLDKYAYNGFMY